MRRPFTILSLAAAGAAVATLALAQGNDPLAAAVKARQAHMTLYAANLGVLGGMAQDRIPYDAEAATAAANNLVALASIDQRNYWPAGSAAGEVEGSRTLPALWENMEDAMAKGAALVEAAAGMQAAAGNGIDALRGAMGPLGASCGACHEAYRQSN